jgi:hypothetical protein
MVRLRLPVAALVVLSTVAMPQPAAAQSDQNPIDLVVSAGRPLRVALDDRVQLKRIGQSVTGTVVQPVYAYHRIVIAKGTRVRGHITGLDSGSAFVRTRAYLAGNFSPPKHAMLQFDTLLLDDGLEMSIDTVVKGGIPNVKRETAGGARAGHADGSSENVSADVEHPTFMARARSELMHRAGDALSETKQKATDTFGYIKSVREPGQMSRLKDAAVQHLPYHPHWRKARSTTLSSRRPSHSALPCRRLRHLPARRRRRTASDGTPRNDARFVEDAARRRSRR